MTVEIKKKAKKLEVVQPVATITFESKSPDSAVPKSSLAQEPVGDPLKFEGPHATVGVNVSATIPTAKFANVKVGVFLSWPCQPTEAEADGAYEFAKAWADGKLQDLTKDIEQFQG
jgi:hypothetical protein